MNLTKKQLSDVLIDKGRIHSLGVSEFYLSETKDLLDEFKQCTNQRILRAALVAINHYNDICTSEQKMTREIRVTSYEVTKQLNNEVKQLKMDKSILEEKQTAYVGRIRQLEAQVKQLQIEKNILMEQTAMPKGRLTKEVVNRGGTQNKRNDITKELINHYLANGCTIDEIAHGLRVSKATLYRRLSEDTEVK